MRIPSLALGFAVLACGVAAHAAGTTRTYVGGSYSVLVDNVPVAWVAKVSGGGVSADVVVEKVGQAGAYPKKHAGNVKYEDIALSINGPMEKGLHDWVRQTLATAQPTGKSGAIVTLDGTMKEQSRAAWTNGVISDFSFPELDGAAKEQASIFLTITPTSIRVTQGGGAAQPTAQGLRSKANVLTASAFRLTLSGLPTSRVAHIDPMSVRFSQVTTPVGELRDYEKTPGKVDVSNLVFTVSDADAAPYIAWHEDFVVKGNNTDAGEKTGSIELLSPDLKNVLYKLNMKGIGILKYTSDKSSSEAIRRTRVECYVESVSLD